MSAIKFSNISSKAVKDPNLTRFIDETAELMKLEILQSLGAAAAPQTFMFKPAKLTVGATQKKYESVGGIFMSRLNKKKPAQRTQILKQATKARLYTAQLKSAALQHNVDMKSSKYVLQQVNLKSKYAFVTSRYSRNFIRSIEDILDANSGGGSSAVINKGLKFRLREVKCLDETNPEWPGRDDIAMGGASVDDSENVTKINEFKVGKFNDGDVKNYNPAKELARFSLSGSYPKTFAVFLSLAEKDSGGFGDFLTELYEAIKAEVTLIFAALGAAAGAAIGAAIGGSVGTAVGGPIGTIIGIAAGLILGALVAWIAAALQDDIFEPQTATVTLPAKDATFDGGSLTSPVQSFVYYDFSGKYRVKYYWEITR